MQVYAGEPEGGGQKCRGRLSVGPERLAIDVELGVKLARPPAREHLAYRRLVHAQKLHERRQVGRERHDGADVQVAIRPAVKALPDSRRERVVDG